MIEHETLDKINLEIRNCKLCKLSTTRNNTVPGEGAFLKRLMIIGEAPGYYEDQSGTPFVGAAGKILRKTLTENNLNSEDLFITNIVKCRPPNNRPPQISEKQICMHYLNRQISFLKPRIICLLGNVASSFILDCNSIKYQRGKIIYKNGLKFFITYHPAATIYNRRLLHTFESDIKKLAQYINELTYQ